MSNYKYDGQFDDIVKGLRVVHDGAECSASDSTFFKDIIIMQILLCDDLLLGSSSRQCLTTAISSLTVIDIARWDATLRHLTEFTFGLIDEVTFQPERWKNEYATPKSFKHFWRTKFDGDYWFLIGPVYPLVVSLISEIDISSTISDLRKWSRFSYKVHLKDLDREAQLEQEYIQAEEAMKTWSYEPALISEISLIMEQFFSSFHVDWEYSCSSNGTVFGLSGALTPSLKRLHFVGDAMCRHLMAQSPDVEPPRRWGTVEDSRVTEVLFVPKSLKTERVISREPAYLIFLQHAVEASIKHYVLDQGPLHDFVSLDHAEFSTWLAKRGSERGLWATIDLHSASDSVTLTLVKQGLRGKTNVLTPLLCTRSRYALLPSGRRVTLEKFAPMGSACCFPMECIIFSAICWLAVVHVAGRPPRKNDFRVYGDDIIIRQEFVDELLRLLELFHFEVNSEKSFWGSWPHNFREACGGEYLDGVSVRPLSLSRKIHEIGPTSLRQVMSDPSAILSWIDLANSCFVDSSDLEQGDRQCAMYGHIRGYALYKLGPLNSSLLRWDGYGFEPPTPYLRTYPQFCTNFQLKGGRHLIVISQAEKLYKQRRTSKGTFFLLDRHSYRTYMSYLKKYSVNPRDYEESRLQEWFAQTRTRKFLDPSVWERPYEPCVIAEVPTRTRARMVR